MSDRQHMPTPWIGGRGKDAEAPRRPVEEKDSLQSKAVVRIVDAICEGEIKGLVNGLSSVFLNETPLVNKDDGTRNFPDVRFELRTGTPLQSPIDGLSEVESEVQVGLEVTAATSVIRTITNPEVNAVRVRVMIPALQMQDQETGDIKGTSVQYAIDVRANAGPWVAQQVLDAGWADFTTTSPPLTSELQGSVGWTPPNINVGGEQYSASIVSRRFQVQHRLLPGGPWTVTHRFDVTGSTDGVEVAFGWWVGGLQLGSYEVRIVDDGTNPSWPPLGPDDGALRMIAASALITNDVITVRGKASSRYERFHRIALSGSAPWDVRLRRISPDSTVSTVQNKTFFAGYTEVVEVKLRFPNTAIGYLQGDASQMPSVPVRGYELDLLLIKVPVNYDPLTRQYTGVWDGTFKIAWSNNPAWVFYDLCTNARYGLGEYVNSSAVDKWGLYSIGQYCDALVPDGAGGTEPRFTINVYLQEQVEAYKLLQDMASAFRGMVFWASGAVTVSQDRPMTSVATYTPANVVGGRFNYAGSSEKQRRTVVLVSWNDPLDFYRRKVEYVEDAEGIERYGVRETSVVAFGCTSRGQAHRAGRWLIASEILETNTVVWRTGMEGALRYPGQVVEIADPLRAGARMGGRVLEGTTTQLTLDAPVTLEPSVTYEVMVVLDAQTMETRTITNAAGTHTVLALASALSRAPAQYSVFAVKSTALTTQLVRLLARTESAANEYELIGLLMEPGKAALVEQGIALERRTVSQIRRVPAKLAGLAHGEYLVYAQDGTLQTVVWFSWDAPEDAGGYRVEWAADNDNWTTVDLGVNRIEIRDARVGAVYAARPRALSRVGLPGPFVLITHEALGKVAPPGNLSAFTLEVLGDGTRRFTCTLPNDIDLAGWEIRVSSGTLAWEAMTRLHTGVLTETPFETSLPAVGTWNFAARAIDTSGNYSASSAIIVATVTDAPAIYTGGITSNLSKDSIYYLPLTSTGLVPWHAWGEGAANGTVRSVQKSAPTKQLTGEPGGVRLLEVGAPTVPGLADGFMFVGPTRKTNNSLTDPANLWPVQVGRTYEYSAYVGVERCNAQAVINWYDGSMNVLGFTNGSILLASAGLSGGNALAQWGRPFVVGSPPPGTVYAIGYVRRSAGLAGPDSSAWVTREVWGEARAGQAEPSPWAPSGISTLDGGLLDPLSVDTPVLQLEASTAIRTASLNGAVSVSNALLTTTRPIGFSTTVSLQITLAEFGLVQFVPGTDVEVEVTLSGEIDVTTGSSIPVGQENLDVGFLACTRDGGGDPAATVSGRRLGKIVRVENAMAPSTSRRYAFAVTARLVLPILFSNGGLGNGFPQANEAQIIKGVTNWPGATLFNCELRATIVKR
jgi:predicted phage tail protein